MFDEWYCLVGFIRWRSWLKHREGPWMEGELGSLV